MILKLVRPVVLAVILLVPFILRAQSCDSTLIGKVKVGGRVNLDGAYYMDKPNMVMSDGGSLSELRLRLLSALSAKTSLKVEVDLANGTITPKDIFIRHYVNRELSFAFGNLPESFSLGSYASSSDSFFMSFSTPVQAFGCSRNLGVGSRYVSPHFFADAGIYGQDLLNQAKGSKGYAFTNRLLYRPVNDGRSVLQFGFSNTIRRADANNLAKDANGNDIELRTVNYASRAETNVDKTSIISVKNPNAQFHDRLSAEFLGIWSKLAVQGEYLNAFVNAKQGFYNQHYYGYYAQVIYQLKGDGIAYNDFEALQTRSGVGTINVGLRYSCADLNDAKGYLVNGIYVDTPSGTTPNGSYNGGIATGIAAAISFSPIKNFFLTLEYNKGKIKNLTTPNGDYQIAQAQTIIKF
jgi:Phosphate-selective porin